MFSVTESDTPVHPQILLIWQWYHSNPFLTAFAGCVRNGIVKTGQDE